MGKIAITVEQQIKKLKHRGMEMDWGDEKAKEILLDIGYYRLGFYWNPFEIDKDHNFEKGTKFSNVAKLYYLDTDLKHILSKAINRIEINFKTQLIYYASIKYNKNPTWFADKKIVSSNYVDKFPNYYTSKFKSDNKPIKKHHAKYPNDIYAPAWKTLEFLTFGSVITLYKSLHNKELKETISNQYNIKSIKVFENFLLTILFIRNICAHSDLLFDSNTPKEIRTTPIIKFNNNNRHCLDSSIKVILYFLKQISNSRHDLINNEIKDTFKRLKDNSFIKKIIVDKIGYDIEMV
ncbi:Abi family protein [Zobellia uliginosa]|uniref:Abi family protein n=1 Tax=Zobellia uliginosa TaxID=143224 RepID=UPI0026E34F2E|nr:Abi family protein [Zobellia uliginosa]MDO6518605.1 Abi family protein [Zobellia uliginosa]